MNRRTTRHFGDLDRAEFLKELGDFKEACVKVSTKAPIGSDAYKLADRFIAEIVKAGESLTGDANYFIMR